MLISAFLQWWYGDGWRLEINKLPRRVSSVSASFSIFQLLKTLFSPWRRIISYPGRSLEDKLRALVDNMFSRVIGFFVRLIVIIAAIVALIFVAAASFIEIIIWPLLPPAVIVFIALGVML